MKYFKEHEIVCKCGCGANWMSHELEWIMDQVREEAGIPLIVESGCRCRKHNKNEGGKEDSAHISEEGNRCEAVDFRANTSRTRFKILRAMINVGFHRIGIAKTFIHGDIDRTKDSQVVWLY